MNLLIYEKFYLSEKVGFVLFRELPWVKGDEEEKRNSFTDKEDEGKAL